MSNNKLKQLIDAFVSVGYEINKLDDSFNNIGRKYGNIEILLSPASQVKNPFSKERIIKLIEVLYSLEYGIVTYDLLCQHIIKLVLQTI